MKLIFPVLFGLEKPLYFELIELGYEPAAIRTEDGQLTLEISDEKVQLAEHIARCNMYLRIAERCLVELFNFEAEDFDALFEQAVQLPWEDYIPLGAKFTLNGYSRKSKLFGVPAMQRLLKKAIIRRLLQVHQLPEDSFIREEEEKGQIGIRFAMVNNQLSLRVETSGEGLHKRGYRPLANEAPIKETLAAGLLDIMRWSAKGNEAFVDLFCGSGTLAIEAAQKAAHIAPGLNRRFAFEDWPYLTSTAITKLRTEAEEKQAPAPAQAFIFASDIDAETVELARANARRAGVADWIQFEVRDAFSVDFANLPEDCGTERVLVLSNPPYGERMADEEIAQDLALQMGEHWLRDGELFEGVHWGVITADEYFERWVGYRADKRRKLYNGMIKCNLYQYFRPGKRKPLY